MNAEDKGRTPVVLDLGRLTGRETTAEESAARTVGRGPGECARDRAAPQGLGPGLDPVEVFARAESLRRRPKTLVSLRIDPDILEFFRAGGPGYQSRMNAVLRAYVEHRRARG